MKAKESATGKLRATSMKHIACAILIVLLAACTGKSSTSTPAENTPTNNNSQTIISNETMQENMQEVLAYLKECGTYFLATSDGNQPRVRPFGSAEIINGRLYIMTGKVKNVYKQLSANGHFELCALKPTGREWLRLSGTLVNDESLAVKEEFLKREPSLNSMYKADDGNMAVLYITDATARFCGFGGKERTIKF